MHASPFKSSRYFSSLGAPSTRHSCRPAAICLKPSQLPAISGTAKARHGHVCIYPCHTMRRGCGRQLLLSHRSYDGQLLDEVPSLPSLSPGSCKVARNYEGELNSKAKYDLIPQQHTSHCMCKQCSTTSLSRRKCRGLPRVAGYYSAIKCYGHRAQRIHALFSSWLNSRRCRIRSGELFHRSSLTACFKPWTICKAMHGIQRGCVC